MNGREHVKSVYEFPAVKESESVEASSVCVTPFPPDVPSSTGKQWTRVGYLDMTDSTQQCPVSLQKFTSPRASCGKKTEGKACDTVTIGTSGASYQTICGRFRGYQVGSPDGFVQFHSDDKTVEGNYVDGISITYGLPGKRQHLFTYAAGLFETPSSQNGCPCVPGGKAPPSFVGSDYYCESGNPGPTWDPSTTFYHADPLWDGQQCGGLEGTCCSPPNLAWFCKTLPAPISGYNLEVRICLDQNLSDENVALEFFELYIK